MADNPSAAADFCNKIGHKRSFDALLPRQAVGRKARFPMFYVMYKLADAVGLLLALFAPASSVLFLGGDPMTPKLIVGGLLAISGVATTQVRPSARSILVRVASF
jgi:hypothetical protein